MQNHSEETKFNRTTLKDQEVKVPPTKLMKLENLG